MPFLMSFDVIMRSGTGKPAARRPGLGQRPGAGSNDGPAIRGQLREQPQRTWKEHDALEVFHFATFDFTILGRVIGMGQVFPHCSKAGAAMRPRNYFVWIKAMLHCPAMPHPGHGASGVDQDAVQVEQYGLTLDSRHVGRAAAECHPRMQSIPECDEQRRGGRPRLPSRAQLDRLLRCRVKIAELRSAGRPRASVPYVVILWFLVSRRCRRRPFWLVRVCRPASCGSCAAGRRG